MTDVVRTTQNLKVDGDVVEASLDLGSVIAGRGAGGYFANSSSSYAKERQRRFIDWRSS